MEQQPFSRPVPSTSPASAAAGAAAGGPDSRPGTGPGQPEGRTPSRSTRTTSAGAAGVDDGARRDRVPLRGAGAGSEQYAADVAAEAERLEGGCWPRGDVDAHPEIARPCRSRSADDDGGASTAAPVSPDPRCAVARGDPRCSAAGPAAHRPGHHRRHQPGPPARRRPRGGGGRRPRATPRRGRARRRDIRRRGAEYQKLLDANPAEWRLPAASRSQGHAAHAGRRPSNAARPRRPGQPRRRRRTDLVDDLDMLGGTVEDAFTRIVNLVARTSDKDRERRATTSRSLRGGRQRRPRVLAGRRNLASALF